MASLTRDLRRQLENTVREARRVAEEGAVKALEQLGIGHPKAPAHLSPAEVKLRSALRAHGRQVGDLRHSSTGAQPIGRLTGEMAYEHWHRMLFARFLAENDLLIEPDSGVAITVAECQEMARERKEDWLALASRYAQTMLPQIFRIGDPVLEVQLPPETRSRLDDLLKGLPHDVFTADDSLGWVYQFWQADNKEAVNRSENKIGADELPAVTQLFTEDYMVWFLLHNTLGAWWASKVLAARPELAANAATEAELRATCAAGDVEWTYLRFVREEGKPWRPAAGTFDGWPMTAKGITLLDPCMGSGHFLVFALPILAALRAQEEGLQPDAAIEAALRDNLYGLELDPRCTQIAAFNLALAAWKRIGYRKLPVLHLACSGLSLGVSREEWLKLAERVAMELPVAPDADLLGIWQDNLFSDATRRGFERLYELFVRAPVLGSLIQPRVEGDLIETGFAELEPLLTKVLGRPGNAELSEMAVAAQGVAKAAQILSQRFTLVATNVPYLGRGKQEDVLKEYCEQIHPAAKADLATCFIERCLNFCIEGGTACVVAPQNWLFLPAYRSFRKSALATHMFNVVVRLGANAFQNMNFWAATTALSVVTRAAPTIDHIFLGLDTSDDKDQEGKSFLLRNEVKRYSVLQSGQLKNPDARITLEAPSEHTLLGKIANAPQGLKTGDDPRLRRRVWEIEAASEMNERWRFLHGAPDKTRLIDGASYLIDYGDGNPDFARTQGQAAWGKQGFVLKLMGEVTAARYFGEVFDSNVTALIPDDEADLPALWEFVRSDVFLRDLRAIEQSVKVNNATVGKVPCDIVHWREVASKSFPKGLPAPETKDATQWVFTGRPQDADSSLHVAVVRLVGYRWPRQTGSSFPDCPALRSDDLESHADGDGIVPLVALKGEPGATERLISLLQDAYGSEWSAAKLVSLLAAADDTTGSSLDDWLLDQFFEQHCTLFHQRPFVWHLWDGRRDGFNVLVNYHKLAAGNGEGRRLLEKLTHTYLGDWIDVRRRDSAAGVEGADARLAAAAHLKGELEKILAGEPPYDLFVRWKPLGEQAIGWEPDINDGVRVNIRPFMAAHPFGARARNACILRTTPRIKWDKDRGKEPQRAKEEFPWFWGWDEATQDFTGGNTFDGSRWNDLHYTNKARRAAREARPRSAR